MSRRSRSEGGTNMAHLSIHSGALPAQGQDSTDFWPYTLVKAIRRLIARIDSEWRIRRTIDVLMELDDRALADVGLTRGSIEHAVRCGRFSTIESPAAQAGD